MVISNEKNIWKYFSNFNKDPVERNNNDNCQEIVQSARSIVEEECTDSS